MRSNFLSNSNSWKLKNMSLFSTLSVQPTQLQRVSLWIQAFSNSTFLYLQIKSREFRKVYKPLYFIFVSNNYKYSNYRIIEILIECSNFFLSLAYLYIEFSLSLSLYLSILLNVFSLLYLSKHSILLLSNESFLYPNNIPWNLQTSQRNFLTRKWYFNRQVSSSISQAKLTPRSSTWIEQ